jgi:hypothetical protein
MYSFRKGDSNSSSHFGHFSCFFVNSISWVDLRIELLGAASVKSSTLDEKCSKVNNFFYENAIGQETIQP